MAERNNAKAGMLTQFNAGEFSSALAGRVDYARLKSSLRKCINGIPEVAGGIKKFYGTKFIRKIPTPTRFVMIPFHHEDALFTLVFRDGIVDAIINDNYVELGLRLPYIIDYSTIRYEQANDVLFLCSPDCAPFQIEYLGSNQFNIRKSEFDDVPYFPFGYSAEYSGPIKTTGISGRITVEKDVELPENSLVLTFPEEFNLAGEVNATGSVYGGAVVEGGASAVSNPSLGDLTLTITRDREGETSTVATITGCGKKIYGQKELIQDNIIGYYGYVSITPDSVLNGLVDSFPNAYLDYVTTTNYKQIVIPMSDIDDHEEGDTYTISASLSSSSVSSSLVVETKPDYINMLPHNGNFYFRANTNNNKVMLRYTNGDTEDLFVDVYSYVGQRDIEGFSAEELTQKTIYDNTQDLVGRKIKFYQNSESDAVKVWYQGLSVSTNDIVLSDGHYYRAKGSGTAGNIKPTHTEGIVSDGKVNWQYLHSGNVSGTIVEIIDGNTMKVDLGKETLPIATYPSTPSSAENTFDNYRWSMWGAFGRWPNQVFFSGGRLGYICDTVAGTYYALSCSDDYFNFSEEDKGKQLDTSAIIGLISGGHVSNKINWVIAREKIYCGSYGAEFVIYSNNDVLTPTNAICRPVSFTGGDKIAALKYMTTSMFVGASGNEIYSVNYDFSSDTYLPNNVSYVSEHLLQDKIKKMVGAPRPDKTIYILTNAGNVVQFVNYITEQVSAFSELELGEPIEDISVSYSGGNTGVYIAKLVGQEIWFERFMVSEPNYMLSAESVELTSPGSMVNLPRLAGREVYVKYSTEYAIDQFKKVTLDDSGKFDIGEDMVEYTVGLPLRMEIHTQPISGSKLEGSQQAPVKMMVRLLNTGSFSYGTSNNYNEYTEFKSWSKSQEYEEEHKLSTGDIELNLPAGYMHKTNAADSIYPNSTGVGLNFISETPEPFNLLLISEVYK